MKLLVLLFILKKMKCIKVFDNIVVDILSNKRVSPIVIEIIISGRKLNISTIFIIKSYFKEPEEVKLYTIFYYENLQKTKFSSTNCL